MIVLGFLGNASKTSRRGVAFGDVWNDRVEDALILNVGEPPTLLRSRTSNRNHWVEFKLVGTKSNRAAIGARLTIKTGVLAQFNEVRGGGSYLSNAAGAPYANPANALFARIYAKSLISQVGT